MSYPDWMSQGENITPALREQLSSNSEACTECGVCVVQCQFLQRHGTPKHIADRYVEGGEGVAFECSLCTLCTAVCPQKIDPSAMFLEMRREAARRVDVDFSSHKGLLAYEGRGTSRLFSWYGLPQGCDTIFFPGCALPGARPGTVVKLFQRLREDMPALGIVLDCCTKPSHDLGRESYFHAMFGEMRDYLVEKGVRRVVVACPNCHQVFSRYGGAMEVVTAYELLAEKAVPSVLSGTVTVHDPCALRFHEQVQRTVRSIAQSAGLQLEEMPHSRRRTICCGEGAGVGFVAADLADGWSQQRVDEAAGRKIISYCAGCSHFLGRHADVVHVADVAVMPETVAEGRAKAARAPFTYLNRLILKKRLKKLVVNPAYSRERSYRHGESKRPGLKTALLAAALILLFIIVRSGGGEIIFEKEKLRAVVEGAGFLAPLVYVLLYAVAPVLFLPGLPLTMAGGLLFGPFWGVVYAITGATLGASLAFLVARYAARDWVEKKLKGPRWDKLHRDVERHGWKVVAFTRLIPLFPFNLLNYAFGVTRVKFTHYVMATFICMLPACIAFIVFSSSLLDLLKGQISPAFMVGMGMIVTVSLIPFLYQRRRREE